MRVEALCPKRSYSSCNAIITDFLRATQIDRLFNRYVRGRFAASQIKLNQLYAPPPMAFGHLYAETFRTLSIGVVYAPIYPPAFILTALAYSSRSTRPSSPSLIGTCGLRCRRPANEAIP